MTTATIYSASPAEPAPHQETKSFFRIDGRQGAAGRRLYVGMVIAELRGFAAIMQ
jgi:hypothetical protein